MKIPVKVIALKDSFGEIGYARLTKGKSYNIHRMYILDFAIIDDGAKLVIIKDNGVFDDIIKIVYEHEED